MYKFVQAHKPSFDARLSVQELAGPLLIDGFHSAKQDLRRLVLHWHRFDQLLFLNSEIEQQQNKCQIMPEYPDRQNFK